MSQILTGKTDEVVPDGRLFGGVVNDDEMCPGMNEATTKPGRLPVVALVEHRV